VFFFRFLLSMKWRGAMWKSLLRAVRYTRGCLCLRDGKRRTTDLSPSIPLLRVLRKPHLLRAQRWSRPYPHLERFRCRTTDLRKDPPPSIFHSPPDSLYLGIPTHPAYQILWTRHSPSLCRNASFRQITHGLWSPLASLALPIRRRRITHFTSRPDHRRVFIPQPRLLPERPYTLQVLLSRFRVVRAGV
jgi:hypothetical protein